MIQTSYSISRSSYDDEQAFNTEVQAIKEAQADGLPVVIQGLEITPESVSLYITKDDATLNLQGHI